MDIFTNVEFIILLTLGFGVIAYLVGRYNKTAGAFATTVLGGSIANFVSPRANLIGVGVAAFLLFLPLSQFLLPPHLDDHNGGEEETSSAAEGS